jgi:4-hydroxybenzoate polyprenyltransferase
VDTDTVGAAVILGFLTAIFIASANYVINEWLDRDFDAHHPTKSRRSAVQRELAGRWVVVEWLLFLAAGLACAYAASTTMLAVACLFALQGVVYNVAPLRTKDRPYLDVISESINNPLRLMIGWAMIDPTTLPPGSVILSYWLGGAFLMGAKRLSEYREIVASHGRELLERYRASFAGYTETSLTVSCFVYAMLSTFFLAVFLLKYRIEYLLLMPLIVALFGHYLALSMHPGSSAQKPEKLFREVGLMVLAFLIALVFVLTTFFDVPIIEPLSAQRFIVVQ